MEAKHPGTIFEAAAPYGKVVSASWFATGMEIA
jgi:hypothetical protein